MQQFPTENILKKLENPNNRFVINLQSITETSEKGKADLVGHFGKSFGSNFFMTPIERRPMTSDERRARKFYSTGKKRLSFLRNDKEN